MRIASRGESLVVEAPAKLNLFLEVLGRRPDGYHDLETVMVAIDLRDRLRFHPSASGEVSIQQRFTSNSPSGDDGRPPSGDGNLVMCAARLLAEAAGVRRGARIELTKRIPWQAGMGGGSSDAAATLVALNQLWNLGLSVTELHELAAQMGSDISFFIQRSAVAICRGRGEIVTATPLGRCLHLLVVQPVYGLSTAEVFREWSIQRSQTPHERPSPQHLLRWLAGDSPSSDGIVLYNALSGPAIRRQPRIASLLRQMEVAGLSRNAMTGSGSACFGICQSRRQARRLAHRFRANRDCRAWAVSTSG